MPFRLRRDTRSWFRDIYESFALDFDMYYLCLCVGIASGRKVDVPAEETTVLLDYFPNEYKPTSRLIVGLFLTAELRKLGISSTDRQALHGAINDLVDPQALSHLSDAGLREINRYSYGGFDEMTEWFDDRPRAFETFFLMYKQRLDALLSSE